MCSQHTHTHTYVPRLPRSSSRRDELDVDRSAAPTDAAATQPTSSRAIALVIVAAHVATNGPERWRCRRKPATTKTPTRRSRACSASRWFARIPVGVTSVGSSAGSRQTSTSSRTCEHNMSTHTRSAPASDVFHYVCVCVCVHNSLEQQQRRATATNDRTYQIYVLRSARRSVLIYNIIKRVQGQMEAGRARIASGR